MSPFRRRALVILLFIGGLVALDRALGLALRAIYDQVRTGEAGGQINAALAHRDAEILVFGSSLARYHVDPRRMRQETGRSCFNAGCDGQDIYYARMLQSLLLERGARPRVMIYVVNWTDLYRDDLPRAKMFAVFADESRVVRETLARAGAWERVKLHSHTYRFNSLAVSMLRNWAAPDGSAVNGFVPVDRAYVASHAQTKEFQQAAAAALGDEDRRLMSKKLRIYIDFVAAARKCGVETALVVGPTFRDGVPIGERERTAIDALRQVAHEHGAAFLQLDEETAPELSSQRCYRDRRHLNAFGADLFTRRLTEALRGKAHLPSFLMPVGHGTSAAPGRASASSVIGPLTPDPSPRSGARGERWLMVENIISQTRVRWHTRGRAPRSDRPLGAHGPAPPGWKNLWALWRV